MTETGSLAKALAAFQAEMPTVAKSKTAKVPTKSGGEFSYTYAGLAEVTHAAMPLLTKHGLSFACAPRRTEQGDYDIVGILLHESGERLEGALPVQGATAQQIGSSLTYGRRYLFGCLTGLVTDDDDDGTLASQSRRAERLLPRDDQWTTEPGGEKQTLPMSERTRKRMFALFREHKITDEDEQRSGMSKIIGRELPSRVEGVTEGEAQAVIAVLAARPKPANEETP